MTSKEIAQTGQAKTIRELFNSPSVRSELTKALPKHLTADKLIRVAMTSIQRTPKLLECSQKSLLSCIMTCAALGLEPDQFLGQAYLVPFWNGKSKQMEAQLIPGYRGYIALARRSGEVQSVSSQAVYSNDHFMLEYGLNEKLEHRPSEGDRGEIRGAYVVFKYKDGSHSFDYMTRSEIDKVRARSKSGEDGPWVTDYPEMAKKTVIKRHVKLAPLSVEFQQAVALEDRAALGESQIDLMHIEEPVDAEFTSTAVEGTKKKAEELKERLGITNGKGNGEDHSNDTPPPPPGDPIVSELEALQTCIGRLSSDSTYYLMQAKKNLKINIDTMPETIDGCNALIDETERLLKERPPKK